MKIFLGCTAFFCLVEFLLYRRRERKLKELTLYLLKLQDGAELPPFESFEEGQLGVLQSEIYKMVNLLDEETKKSNEGIVSRVNHLNEAIHNLEEELEHKVSVDELSAYLEMPAAEIEDVLRMSGDQIEIEKDR